MGQYQANMACAGRAGPPQSFSDPPTDCDRVSNWSLKVLLFCPIDNSPQVLLLQKELNLVLPLCIAPFNLSPTLSVVTDVIGTTGVVEKFGGSSISLTHVQTSIRSADVGIGRFKAPSCMSEQTLIFLPSPES